MSNTGPDRSNFDIISAIANKDAAVEDIAARLHGMGIKTLEDFIRQARQGHAEQEAAIEATRTLVDIRRFSATTEYTPRTDSVHRVPAIPVLVDRVLYDPADIVRFNGRELHSVLAPDHKSLVAVTDKNIMNRWWELSLIANTLPGSSREQGAVAYGYHPTYPPPDPVCTYYEHPGRQGSTLDHGANRGYADLTRIHSGFGGWGASWNDRISCVFNVNMWQCVLHEHIAWAGSSLSLPSSISASPEGPVAYPMMYIEDLRSLGWNDRASSVEGW